MPQPDSGAEWGSAGARAEATAELTVSAGQARGHPRGYVSMALWCLAKRSGRDCVRVESRPLKGAKQGRSLRETLGAAVCQPGSGDPGAGAAPQPPSLEAP